VLESRVNVIYPTRIPTKISGYFLWSRCVMLGSAERRKPMLISYEIISRSIPTYTRSRHDTSTPRTDRQTTYCI